MNYKKTIISVTAIIAIVAVIYGLYSWQKSLVEKPTRQDSSVEIR